MPERDAERPVRRFGGWRPWHGRPRARDVLCTAAIAVSASYAVVAIPLTPVLIATHPVLLELLTDPRRRSWRRGRTPMWTASCNWPW